MPKSNGTPVVMDALEKDGVLHSTFAVTPERDLLYPDPVAKPIPITVDNFESYKDYFNQYAVTFAKEGRSLVMTSKTTVHQKRTIPNLPLVKMKTGE